MKLPTKSQCNALWDKYKMPKNIRAHTRQVTKVADKVARHIASKGVDVHLDLVNRGALLHDIAKIISVESKRKISHGKRGAEIVEEEGFAKELGRVIGNHVLREFDFDIPLEDQIVNYADSRVLHQKVVGLQERMDDLEIRYPQDAEYIDEKTELYKEFEEKYNINF